MTSALLELLSQLKRGVLKTSCRGLLNDVKKKYFVKKLSASRHQIEMAFKKQKGPCQQQNVVAWQKQSIC